MKKYIVPGLAAILTMSSLTACESTGPYDTVDNAPVENAVPVDPNDSELHDAIQQFLIEHKGPKNSQYEYTRADLNGDGLREGIVLFNLPHSYWCGWSGCTMAIFAAGDNNFSILSETSRIRGPIVVGETKTNGWDDIGVRLSGTDSADRNILLKYDGTTYPENPLFEASVPFDLASIGGMRIFP